MSGGFYQNVPPSVVNTPVSLPLRSADLKSPTAFRTISEVATDLEVPQHVLRFWESKFQQIRPLKRGGGRRYYRPEDIQLISSIKDMLYNQGFTIRGVQKLLKENGRTGSSRTAAESPTPGVAEGAAKPAVVASAMPVGTLPPEKRRAIEGVLSELKSLREMLRQSGI